MYYRVAVSAVSLNIHRMRVICSDLCVRVRLYALQTCPTYLMHTWGFLSIYVITTFGNEADLCLYGGSHDHGSLR